MSTTTQILFNSPALHSLKREQLVKLCKIHGIKANGKNVDIIERLKQHAQDIPDTDATNDADPSVIQNDSEDTDQDTAEDSQVRPLARPSEQWEMVMEDIEEVEESGSMGTFSSTRTLQKQGSAGEFGTSNSKNSVSTSLKALANSLGLKRALTKTSSNSKIFPTSDPELDKHAVPYSSIPQSESLPRTDADGDISMDAPIPGGPSRPGAPAPPNARLSTGEGLTTTIRLISSTSREIVASPPKLKPFEPAFDLIMSPNMGRPGHRVNVWPASPGAQGRLYPSLDELMAVDTAPGGLSPPVSALSAVKRASLTMPSDNANDIFSPKKHIPAAPAPLASLSMPRSEPFLFGSPLPTNRPRTSNADFDKAAASVLSEMNKRLAESGVQGVDVTALNKRMSNHNADVFGGQFSATTRQRTDSAAARFAKAHDDAFSKMDSIATHYAARRGAPPAASGSALAPPQTQSNKRKSDALGLGPAPGPTKRKSSAANARVISNGVRKKMIPGGFGDEEVEDDEEEAVEDAGDRRSSKRIRVAEGTDVHKGGRRVSLLATVTGDDETEADRAREERKREVMKKKLDESRARRRSSRARVSVGGKAVPIKPKASRFGFLSSAKSLVRNVWNMGAAGNASKATSSIPVPKPAPAKVTPAPVQQEQTKAKHAALGLGKPSTSKNTADNHLRIPSNGTTAFNTSSQGDHKPPAERARTGSTVGTASRIPSRTGSTTGFSSMGTRTSMTPGTNAASSMGTKRSLVPSTVGSTSRLRMDSTDSRIPPVPKRLSSTLMAPTASSLAKRQSAIRYSSMTARSPSGSTLQQITNSPQSPPGSPSGKIFSTPFTGFGSPTSIPHAIQKSSFTSAGTALFGADGAGAGLSGGAAVTVPPKPRAPIGRKPRISRSRVIAKLGAQRAAGNTGGGLTPAGATPNAKSRTRSSMGAGVARRSMGGVKAAGARNSAGGDLMAGAKKRVRQSEIAARRKSRMTAGTSRMSVDDA
ncbi:hypothetical protein EUX98_g6915 [Antrodiella citrinella]|uniref:SAP domain-containing protein n=1 Tax=Antrodiella citrinella TaxID=2447956 RepID=A0A4V3XHZ1_9APHY|nr:hypothetical protein EUX98_g6915 [Antrodiella citrinella]